LYTPQTIIMIIRLAPSQNKTIRVQPVLKQARGAYMTTLQPLDIRRALTSFDLALRSENKSPRQTKLYSLAVRQRKVVDERAHHLTRPTWHCSHGHFRSPSPEGWRRPGRHDRLRTSARSQGRNHFSNHNPGATIGKPVVMHTLYEVGRAALKA